MRLFWSAKFPKNTKSFFLLALIYPLLIVPIRYSAAPVAIHEFHAPQIGLLPQQPQVTTTQNGGIFLVYGAGNRIYCFFSSDQGKTFSEVSVIESGGTLALGRHRGPRIAVSGQTVVITAVVGEKGHGRDGDLLAWRSTDHGKNWNGPTVVSEAKDCAREGLQSLAAGPDNRIFAAWLDLRTRKGEAHGTLLYGALSADGGKTWEENRLIYQSPDGSICTCCHPSVIFDQHGTLYVMWRNALGGMRDLYYTTSTDGAKSFGTARKLGRGSWLINSCPMDGGEIDVTDSGVLASVWRRQGQIYLSMPDSEEILLGNGQNPAIACGLKGRYVAWEAAEKGIFLLGPGERGPVSLSSTGKFVDLAASREGHVVAAWEESGPDEKVIKLEILE